MTDNNSITNDQITGSIKITNTTTGQSVETHNDAIYTYGKILQSALNPTAQVPRTLNYMYIEYAPAAYLAEHDIPDIDILSDPITNYYATLNNAENGTGYIAVPITMVNNTVPEITSTTRSFGLTFLSVTSGEDIADITSVIYGGALVSLDTTSANPTPIVWSRMYLPNDPNNQPTGIPVGTGETAFQWTINFNTGTAN